MFYISDLLGGARELIGIGNATELVLNARDWPSLCSNQWPDRITAMAVMLYAYQCAGKLLNKKVELD